MWLNEAFCCGLLQFLFVCFLLVCVCGLIRYFLWCFVDFVCLFFISFYVCG